MEAAVITMAGAGGETMVAGGVAAVGAVTVGAMYVVSVTAALQVVEWHMAVVAAGMRAVVAGMAAAVVVVEAGGEPDN